MSLSNIGDVVLTLPVIDTLRAAFPSAELHLIVGPKSVGLFDGNPWITRVIAYNKKMTWSENLSWFYELRRWRFDLVVDLRNSMLPFLLNTRWMTWPVFFSSKVHMKAKHLARLAQVFDDPKLPVERSALLFSVQQNASVDQLLKGADDFVLVAPGAADPRKRWCEEGFVQVIRHLRVLGKTVVLTGDKNDRIAGARITSVFSDGVLDLCGRTTLSELAGIAARASLAVTNDSGIMHLASYFDRPVIALFGYTDPFFYGPWSSRCTALRKGDMIDAILVNDVIALVDEYLC